MTKLVSGDLSLEVQFQEIDEQNWIQYAISFLWQNQPLINTQVLKRHNEYWATRGRDGTAFRANEYGGDTLIPVLDKVLETNEPEYWQPIEPDVTIGFYPNLYFPFLKSHWVPVPKDEEDVGPDEKPLHEEVPENDGASHDIFTLIVLIDTQNLKDCHPYTGEGPALIMQVRRQDLEAFCVALKEEYCALEEKYR
jgi:hypothetical protein